MTEKSAQTRLCPYCANSIAEDAADCSYCNADLSSQFIPQWLKRDEPSEEPRVASDNLRKPAMPEKFIWIGAMLIGALVAFFAGGYMQRSALSLSSQTNLKQLQAKDQMIQSQEEQLAKTRQQLNDDSNQLAEMKNKLEESRNELSLTQQRLAAATRQIDHPTNARQSPVAATPSRARDTTVANRPPTARRTAAPGVYETTRMTPLHENPSASSRVIAQIDGGTRLNVVSSTGDWLEVRSKRGNPPGYVRSEDARLLGGAS